MKDWDGPGALWDGQQRCECGHPESAHHLTQSKKRTWCSVGGDSVPHHPDQRTPDPLCRCPKFTPERGTR